MPNPEYSIHKYADQIASSAWRVRFFRPSTVILIAREFRRDPKDAAISLSVWTGGTGMLGMGVGAWFSQSNWQAATLAGGVVGLAAGLRFLIEPKKE